MTKLYLCGPMTKVADFNYPEFNRIAALLRESGHEVVNPAEFQPPCAEPKWEDWMRQAIPAMLTCEALARMSGASQSRGATLEMSVAASLRMPCRRWQDWLHCPLGDK